MRILQGITAGMLAAVLCCAGAAWGDEHTDAEPDPAHELARRCVAEMRAIAEECIAENRRTAVECVERIRILLEEGKEREARQTAARCIEHIREHTRECSEEIIALCRRCIRILTEEFEEEQLAERVRRVCHDELDHVEASMHRAVAHIRGAFGEQADPDPAHELARRCIREARAKAERCAHALRELGQEAVHAVKEILASGSNGSIGEARRVAAGYLEQLDALAERCIEELEQHCERCVQALLDEYDAEELAQRVREACANQIELIRRAREAAAHRIEALFHELERPGQAERLAQQCRERIQEHAERCVEQNKRVAAWCADKVKRLLEAGEEERARHHAELCIQRIERQTEQCAGLLRQHCRRCVELLIEQFGAERLAARLRAFCEGQLELLYQSERRAIRHIRETLGGEAPDSPEELTARGFPAMVRGDVTLSGKVDSTDIQLVINKVLGVGVPEANRYDVNDDGTVDAVDIQVAISAALGL